MIVELISDNWSLLDLSNPTVVRCAVFDKTIPHFSLVKQKDFSNGFIKPCNRDGVAVDWSDHTGLMTK